MTEPRLVEPSIAYKDPYIEMMEEWRSTGEQPVPFVLRFDYEDFGSMLGELRKLRDNPKLDEKTVNSSTF